jgi:hypothetical protein
VHWARRPRGSTAHLKAEALPFLRHAGVHRLVGEDGRPQAVQQLLVVPARATERGRLELNQLSQPPYLPHLGDIEVRQHRPDHVWSDAPAPTAARVSARRQVNLTSAGAMTH